MTGTAVAFVIPVKSSTAVHVADEEKDKKKGAVVLTQYPTHIRHTIIPFAMEILKSLQKTKGHWNNILAHPQ